MEKTRFSESIDLTAEEVVSAYKDAYSEIRRRCGCSCENRGHDFSDLAHILFAWTGLAIHLGDRDPIVSDGRLMKMHDDLCERANTCEACSLLLVMFKAATLLIVEPKCLHSLFKE